MIEALYIDWLSLSTQLMMSYVQSSPILLGRFWRFLSFESNFWHKYHLISCQVTGLDPSYQDQIWWNPWKLQPSGRNTFLSQILHGTSLVFLNKCNSFDLFDKKHGFKSQEQERSKHRSEAATVYQNSWVELSWVEPLSR